MSLKLIVSKPNGENSGPLSIAEARPMVRGQIDLPRGSQADGWRLRTRGDPFGAVRHDLGEVMDKWEEKVRVNDRIGDVVVVDILEHPYSAVSRWIEDKPSAVQTEGNKDIDIIYSWWHDKFPNSRNAGICVFKGNPPSQHCKWTDNNEVPGDGSNASDEFLATMSDMKDAAADFVRESKRFSATDGAEGIPGGRMIIDRQIWDPFQGWHSYTGDQHYHNHMEGRYWLISGVATRC